MSQEDAQESDFFVFDEKQRAAILASVDLPEGELADKLILFCEMAAGNALDEWDLYQKLPNAKAAKWRIDSIRWHLEQAIDLASFGADKETRHNFWAIVVGDKNRVVLESAFDRFRKAFNTIVLSERFLSRTKIDGRFTTKTYSIEILRECVSGNDFLKLLSVVYSNVLTKKCGRSKSTIWPFVRFAHSVMLSIDPNLTPSIETINERWARLSFDPTKKRIPEDTVNTYCAKRGVRSPLSN